MGAGAGAFRGTAEVDDERGRDPRELRIPFDGGVNCGQVRRESEKGAGDASPDRALAQVAAFADDSGVEQADAAIRVRLRRRPDREPRQMTLDRQEAQLRLVRRLRAGVGRRLDGCDVRARPLDIDVRLKL